MPRLVIYQDPTVIHSLKHRKRMIFHRSEFREKTYQVSFLKKWSSNSTRSDSNSRTLTVEKSQLTHRAD